MQHVTRQCASFKAVTTKICSYFNIAECMGSGWDYVLDGNLYSNVQRTLKFHPFDHFEFSKSLFFFI